MTKQQIPTYKDLLWPTLKALEVRGGSASIQELVEQISIDLKLPDQILDVIHNDGPRTEVEYRSAWARTHLKIVEAIDNTSRGIWTITEKGRGIQSETQVRELVRDERAKRRKDKKNTIDDPETESEGVDVGSAWQAPVLDILRKMKPDAFERLCQRILRESGFATVEVTGRAGDGGIDGAGVLRVNLISFRVLFQCKRYSGSVSAPEIRKFQGAVVGRADKGLFITTGRFTRDAEREAVRDGAPAIDLIPGNDLCDLLKTLELGVSTQVVEVVKPIPEFFARI